ncbi:MAG TPA: FKBP-type peptidyl-prolyl cis-trans isomerase [Candidatus Nanoarchaeia archaeon]|nr:FKBP-type peptidyl-prolyl cis-trans isomerase [Candidatus Nanoarchaeia archaeon]
MKIPLCILLGLSLILLACSAGPVAEIGDRVTVEYEATFANGSLYEKSSDYDMPVTFNIGNREVLVGLEKAVLGMHEDESIHILLSPEAAYGLHDPEQVELIPLEEFPNMSRLRVGMVLAATSRETGESVEGKIINVTSEGIVVDFNHPMAGESLWMDITMKKIVKG